MEAGTKKGDMRLSNPIGRMWTLLRWDGGFWRMLPVSEHQRDDVLRWAFEHGLYDRIVGGKAFTPWTAGGCTYRNIVEGNTLYTVRLNDSTLVAIDDATCHESPWPALGVPSIGKGE